MINAQYLHDVTKSAIKEHNAIREAMEKKRKDNYVEDLMAVVEKEVNKAAGSCKYNTEFEISVLTDGDGNVCDVDVFGRVWEEVKAAGYEIGFILERRNVTDYDYDEEVSEAFFKVFISWEKPIGHTSGEDHF